MIKILIFSPRALENGRGGEISSIELATGLKDFYNVKLIDTNILYGKPLLSKNTIFKKLKGIKTDKIYFAFKCFTKSSKIVANIYERDQIQKSDDAIFILIDSFLDKRSAYGFFVNPLGTQTDIKFADDGRNEDINWDTQWETATSMNSWGWSVEIAIPFSSIAYNASLVTWGVNFGRVIRNNSETCCSENRPTFTERIGYRKTDPDSETA